VAKPRRFVTFYISAVEILLLTYLITKYCCRLRRRRPSIQIVPFQVCREVRETSHNRFVSGTVESVSGQRYRPLHHSRQWRHVTVWQTVFHQTHQCRQCLRHAMAWVGAV